MPLNSIVNGSPAVAPGVTTTLPLPTFGSASSALSIAAASVAAFDVQAIAAVVSASGVRAAGGVPGVPADAPLSVKPGVGDVKNVPSPPAVVPR